MKLMRKLAAPAVVGIMSLAGLSAVMATTASAALAAPVAAHSTTAVQATGTAHSAAAPATVWQYYSQYPTQAACNSEGDYLYFHYQIGSWECVQMSEGEYFVWYLYTTPGHGPGS